MGDEHTQKRLAVSLFSGAGGMDIGFARAGFESLVACEIDADACESFNKNLHLVGHRGNAITPTSVRDIDLSRVPEDIDIVYGGPPCQGFSVAGKMDPDDERSDLIHAFFDTVDELKPRSFVCENVKALAISDRWAAVRKKIFDRTNPRYSVALVVLTATDFGVPQNRERMFLIGVRRDLYDAGGDALMTDVQQRLDSQRAAPPTVAEIVRSLGAAGSASNPVTCTAKVAFAKSPILRKSPYAGMLFNGAGRPIRSEGFSSTLPASMGGNKTPIVDEAEILQGKPSLIEAYHAKLLKGCKAKPGEAPKRLRRLTIKECARIQTFPDEYNFHGKKSSVYRQIGNAVPCKLAEAVARSVDGILSEAEASRDSQDAA
ncbi:DNA (cytosine-5)-methyltransferase 1 [Mameliella alba]|uniref:DNA cytosine methyltransferase n=1 Tax=Mameliella alba TaxID=561184 RepID=UPI0008919364|nr:DNA cytosine methyltransferase [Mameliella alba]OWV39863.1 DNA cytosine methyltransferase [Mameliella alba]PTR32759.1 DNA (cytosine-5)-methyltransferase 1 [Mameliella alba]GGF86442.1 cytosine-specific methyltransferase [Mameliella alba]SDE36313.1 DNA (cytosine-5)-methyltransferase 1 [Mameliella alba]